MRPDTEAHGGRTLRKRRWREGGTVCERQLGKGGRQTERDGEGAERLGGGLEEQIGWRGALTG